ncbi:dTDP-4-dehydrorhamnose reductase [Parafilimonas terrae]|uniref:dTDP-4-dehydrorhamnose reductase n=1 Tax=Parafilimonas terrae TaxID=1465490 RepID=A0A1I5XPY9_9BACT|nr:dTDP-4-dehydrorhamnose reductase [Parafilimonas terrae]SFQ34022.1 dTDP-4-dehydrorhamnose reductase [Parafilimonas terrae]
MNYILVSGKKGQLGSELKDIASEDKHQFIFTDRDDLDIANEDILKEAFEKYKPAFFINCAAYTAVDKAETDQATAYKINAEAVGNIAKQCHQYNTRLIHISTDYVFDGKGTQPYKTDDKTDPVNYYGYTKLTGEQLALNNSPQTIVIRTSWVYSAYGANFVKTMLRLMKERRELNVVSDQFGSPTYAKDLAEAIIQIVSNERPSVSGRKTEEDAHSSQLTAHGFPGIYHFSNEGDISWYDFAVAIRDIKQLDCAVNPIPTSAYPTPAKRPAYSVFDKTKIVNTFNIQLKDWKDSLKECLSKL